MKTTRYKQRPILFNLFIRPCHLFLWLFRGDRRVINNLALETLITIVQLILALLTTQTIYIAFSGLSLASHGFAMLPIFEGVDPARMLPIGILQDACKSGTACAPVAGLLPKLPVIGALFRGDVAPLAGSVWESSATLAAFGFAYVGAGLWSHLQGFLTRPETSQKITAMVEKTRSLKKVKATPDTLPIHGYYVRKHNRQGSGFVLLMRLGWLLTFILEAAGVIATVPAGFSLMSLSLIFWAMVQAAGFELVENFRLRLLGGE